MWPFTPKTMRDRYSKLVNKILSINSRFYITENTDNSIRIHLSNDDENDSMDFHIYLSGPFLYISYMAEMDGTKVSNLNCYPKDTGQIDIFNMAMASNLAKTKQILADKYEEEFRLEEENLHEIVQDDVEVREEPKEKLTAVILKRMPDGSERYASIPIDELALSKSQRIVLYSFVYHYSQPCFETGPKTRLNVLAKSTLDNYRNHLELNTEDLSQVIKDVSILTNEIMLENIRTIYDDVEKQIFIYICNSLLYYPPNASKVANVFKIMKQELGIDNYASIIMNIRNIIASGGSRHRLGDKDERIADSLSQILPVELLIPNNNETIRKILLMNV